jgi:hypothetical protein
MKLDGSVWRGFRYAAPVGVALWVIIVCGVIWANEAGWF